MRGTVVSGTGVDGARRGPFGSKTSLPATGQPPLRCQRATSGHLVAGVARGLAGHLGVDILVVRLAFVALTLAGGMGAVLYGALWVFLPPQPGSDAPDGDRAARAGTSRPDLGHLLALGALALGGVLLADAAGLPLGNLTSWPLLLAGFGVVLLWRETDILTAARWSSREVWRRPSHLARTAVGVALVLVGGGLFLASRGQLQQARQGLMATAVAVTGLALVTGPWWLRTVRELATERRERIRSQERAELAAHVHDSLLQTLTLIQRHAGDAREVQRLARAQERDLRGWLYRTERPPDDRHLVSALGGIVAEVEDRHGATLDLVAVGGDAPVEPVLSALLAAAREAMVNAARYAGAYGPVSVYAEMEPTQVSVFVRDRGPGFDLADVPPDRLGVRESIIGRMQRHGGRATVRRVAGRGTEVALVMPRQAR